MTKNNEPSIFTDGIKQYMTAGGKVFSRPLPSEASAQRIRVAVERLGHNLDSLLNGYHVINGADKQNECGVSWQEMRTTICKARVARETHPYILRGVESMKEWAYSVRPQLDAVTTNEALQEVINGIVANIFSDVWDVDLLSECEATDGGIVALLQMNDDGTNVSVQKMEIRDFDPDMAIKDTSRRRVWLHRYDYSEGGKAHAVFYPDCLFNANDALRERLEMQVAKIGNGTIEKRIEWDRRVMRYEFNRGWPVVAAPMVYAACLDSIIELQSAVLEAIASAASHYQTDSWEEVGQAQQHYQDIADSNATGAFESFRTIGSGRLTAVNLRVAMLEADSALMVLLESMVYNGFAGLRPEDWSAARTGGLNQSDSNRKQIVAAKMRQQRMSRFLERTIECVLVWLLSDENGDLDIAGVDFVEESYRAAVEGELTFVRHLTYDDSGDRIKVSWPEIDTADLAATVSALVDAYTLKGREQVIGTADDIRDELAKLGVTVTADENGNDSVVEALNSVKSLRAQLGDLQAQWAAEDAQ